MIVTEGCIARPVWMNSLVPLEYVEAALSNSPTDVAVWCDPQTLHAFDVCSHMGLADQYGFHTDLTKIFAKGPLADSQWGVVRCRAMRQQIATRIGAHSSWATDRRLDIAPVEPNAVLRQPVDIWSL